MDLFCPPHVHERTSNQSNVRVLRWSSGHIGKAWNPGFQEQLLAAKLKKGGCKAYGLCKAMGPWVTVEFGFSGSNLGIRNTTMMLISVYLSAKDWMGAESDQDMWNLCHSLILTNTVIVTVVGQHIHHVSDPKAWRKSLWTWTDTTSRLCICMCIYIQLYTYRMYIYVYIII